MAAGSGARIGARVAAIPPAFISRHGQFINRTSISGEVTHVDENARTFKVHWLSPRGSWDATVNTTEKTTYVSGSWTEMKRGIHVKVACHLEGPNSDTVVADSVQIISGS